MQCRSQKNHIIAKQGLAILILSPKPRNNEKVEHKWEFWNTSDVETKGDYYEFCLVQNNLVDGVYDCTRNYKEQIHTILYWNWMPEVP